MNASNQPTTCGYRDKERPHADRSCKLVIFYQEFSDAIRAHQAFDTIVENFGHGREVRATSWSFHLLGRPELNAAVIRDSALADVIVIATDGRREVPERVQQWVEICMDGSPGARPVVVALHDEGLEADGAAAPLCSSLKQIADRRGAAFMCNHDLGIRTDHQTVEEPICVRHAHSGSDFERPLYRATETVRWWGMND
jgi:hypothetical protein